MNFYFGHINSLSNDQASLFQAEWLNKTIFSQNSDCISTHIEEGFSLTLINDPKKTCPFQSQEIYISDDFVCATDCRLFNKAELATQLDINPDSDHEEFFVSAYLKWGEEFPNKFNGKFSFIIWDRNHKYLLAGLDHLGYGNFAYSQVAEDCYFSSDLEILLDQPKVDKSINMKRFYQCFHYSNNTAEQSYFQHCHYCPASHVIKISKTETRTIDYWKLLDNNFSQKNKTQPEYTEEFISILQAAMDQELDENQKLGLMLSGGYDSNLLAAVLANKKIFRKNLICYSYVFDKFKSCDESQYIKSTLQQLNLSGKLINCDDKTILSDLATRHVPKEVINLDSYSSLPETIYKKARQDRLDVLISGLNGDDIFGGVRYMYADLLIQKQYLTIIKKMLGTNSFFKQAHKLLQFGIRPILPQSVKSVYRTFVKTKGSNGAFNISSDQVNCIESQSALKRCKLFHHQKLLKLIYFRSMPETLYYLRKNLYLRYNLQLLLPYYTKQMLEYMWQLPVQHLEEQGKFRGVQISSLRKFNLQHILNRKSKTSFHPLIEQGIIENKHRILQIVESSKLIESTMVDKNVIQNLVTEIGKSQKSWPIRIFILVELWWRLLNQNETNKTNTGYSQMNINI